MSEDLKNFIFIPSIQDREKAYNQLLHAQPLNPSVIELARYSQWARFDPRLGEIWVDYVRHHWKSINPSDLALALRKEAWPSAAAVLLEFTSQHPPSSALPHWCKVITNGIEKDGAGQFYVGLRQLGGDAMLEDVLFSMNEYRSWGYFAREDLLHRRINIPLPKDQRLEILKGLLQTSPRITTADYWVAIGKCVSKRQAERDLKRNALLRPYGRTKDRYFGRRGGQRE